MTEAPEKPVQSTLSADAEAVALDRLSRHRAKPVRAPAQQLSTRVSRLLSKYADRDGPGLPLLQRRWKDLVGERLAKLSYPVKLSGKGLDRVLTLEILPAASTIFQHQSDFLKQHLTSAIGGTLKDIKLVQKSSVGHVQSKATHTRPLTAQEREEIQAGLNSIKNPKLAAALLAFGQAIYTQKR